MLQAIRRYLTVYPRFRKRLGIGIRRCDSFSRCQICAQLKVWDPVSGQLCCCLRVNHGLAYRGAS